MNETNEKNIVNEIYNLRLAMMSKGRQVEDAKLNMKLLESKIMKAIVEEKDCQGKPAYPNDTARNSQFQDQLSCSNTYVKLKEEYDKMKTELDVLGFELERQQNLFKLMTTIFIN